LSIEDKVIEILSSSQNYVSGTNLASMLGVSRATVNRVIKKLIAKGYPVDVHPRLGYRLVMIDDLSSLSLYVKNLNTYVKYSVHYLPACSSTQDIAESLAIEGASEGTVVIAERMERGRGRLRRSWSASEGGLWFSVILRPPFVKNLQLVTLAIGVGVASGIRKSTGLEVKLKWPNDVLYNGKKVGGILVEGKLEADKVHYIIGGIGVNVNNTLPLELTELATTLSSAAGKKLNRIPIFLSILRELDAQYSLLLRGEEKNVVKEWKKLSCTLNKMVEVIMDNEKIVGLAVDLLPDGALLVKTGESEFRKIYSGDIIHLREA
jgi:BirA family biotin operon repressor/biotin-[acetyl-CoA-carboxylase] ligase